MKNVVIITNLPVPYKIDFYNEFGKQVNLTVIFEANSTSNQKFNWKRNEVLNFKSIFLSQKNLNEKKIHFTLFKHINNTIYDSVIFSTYHTLSQTIGIFYAKLFKVKYTFETDGGIIPSYENWFKKQIKKSIISGAQMYFSPSKNSDSYLNYYGAPLNKIKRYPFSSNLSKDILDVTISTNEKSILKKELGIKENRNILSVGQFIHRKGFDILLKSAKNLPADIGIYIIGGKVTDEYLKIITELALTNIYFIDFKDNDTLLKWYKASDLFVLPTREDIWGLVINEAMTQGLPVITTDNCMAGLEMIKDKNCIVPVGNSVKLSESINSLLSDPEQLKKIGENNLNIIKEYSIEKMAFAHFNHLN